MNADEWGKLKKIRDKQSKVKAKLEREAKAEKKRLKKLRWNKKQSNRLQRNQRDLKNPNELKFREYLKSNNINYIWQQPFYDKERYVCVDFYLIDYNIVIEIDGSVHDKQKQKDLDRTLYLKKIHNITRVIRFTNKEVLMNPEKINKELLDIK